MSVHVTQANNRLMVWGATYGIRDQIEELGGRWDPKFGVWKLPLLDIDLVRKKLTDALEFVKAAAIKNSLRRVSSMPSYSMSEQLSMRRLKSVYTLPRAKPFLPQAPLEPPVKKEVEKEPPAFFVQSVAEELAEARSPRSSGTSSRRSSYGVTQTGHLLAHEILSPKALESAVSNAKDDVRLAKKKLNTFGSIEFAAIKHAQRGQRGIEDACRALIDVDDLYKKEQALDEAELAWYHKATSE